MCRSAAIALLVVTAAATITHAEDGYELWLRYQRVDDAAVLKTYQNLVTTLVVGGNSPTMRIVSDELQRGLGGLLGANVTVAREITRPGTLVVGTPSNTPLIAQLSLAAELRAAGDEGYLIRTVKDPRGPATVIAANTDVGVLHGAFHFLRLLQTHQSIETLAIAEHPRIQHRILDHWDNLDGSVERGTPGDRCGTGSSCPTTARRVTADYARANASLGINGTVLTNVNANATSLTPEYSRQGRSARRRLSTVRHPRLSRPRGSARRPRSAA
jgi:alpha-glucuronidase